MRLQIDNLGKVSVTVEESYWDITKDYDKLTVVEKEGTFGTYVSRKPVPAGTVLTDREYWIPFSSLKEDILLDYNSFIAKYGEELEAIKDHIDEIDAQLSILNELNENTNEAIAVATNAIEVATTAIDSAKDTLSKAEDIINANEAITAKVQNIGDNVKIGDNTTVGKSVNIMDGTKIASKTYINKNGLWVDNNHLIGYDDGHTIKIGTNNVQIAIRGDDQNPISIFGRNGSIVIGSKASFCVEGSKSVTLGTSGASGTGNVVIGDNVRIKSDVSIDEKITIDNGHSGALTISTDTSHVITLGNNSMLGTDTQIWADDADTVLRTILNGSAKTLATTEDVDNRVNELVNGAPAAYDTLKEIADKLQDNDDVVAGLVTTLGQKADKTSLSNIKANGTLSEVTNSIFIEKDGVRSYPITKATALVNNNGDSCVFGNISIGTTDVNIVNDGVNIYSGAYIGSDATLLQNAIVGTNTVIGDEVKIGQSVNIAANTNIAKALTVAADGSITTGVGGVSIGKALSLSVPSHGIFQIGPEYERAAWTYDEGLVVISAGFKQRDWLRIGTEVAIGSDVEIGSCVTISDNISIKRQQSGSDVEGFIINDKNGYVSWQFGTGLQFGNYDFGCLINIAPNTAVHNNVTIGTKVTIGSAVDIGNNISIGSSVAIGSGVAIAENLQFSVVDGILTVTVNGTQYGVTLNTL